MKRFLGYTWVGWLNILVIQWLFVRLSRMGDITTDGVGVATFRAASYGIIGFVLPCSGWGWGRLSSYRWLGAPWEITIWRCKHD
jgi:hypothetical protein